MVVGWKYMGNLGFRAQILANEASMNQAASHPEDVTPDPVPRQKSNFLSVKSNEKRKWGYSVMAKHDLFGSLFEIQKFYDRSIESIKAFCINSAIEQGKRMAEKHGLVLKIDDSYIEYVNKHMKTE